MTIPCLEPEEKEETAAAAAPDTPKDKKEEPEDKTSADQPQLSLGEIAAIEKSIANSKVDTLQALHNVRSTNLKPFPTS